MGNLVEDVVRRQPQDEVGGVLVEFCGGEVGVALDLAGGKHALADVGDIGVELEVLGNRHAHRALRPNLQDFGNESRPKLDQGVLDRICAVVGLAAELEALHDVFVAVVDDPLHEFDLVGDDSVEHLLVRRLLRADAGKTNQHLEAVLLPEVELRLRVGALLRIRVVAPVEPHVGAPGRGVVAAGLLHGCGCLVLVGDEPVVVAILVQRTDIADDGLRCRLREIAHWLSRKIEVDVEVGEHAAGKTRRNGGDNSFCVHKWGYYSILSDFRQPLPW